MSLVAILKKEDQQSVADIESRHYRQAGLSIYGQPGLSVTAEV